MSEILSVKNVSIAFGKSSPVVHGISYSLARGETIGIVGESGSGKSLSSLAVMGLLPKFGKVTEGEILFEGKNLLNLKESELRRYRGNGIAMIFQEPMTSLNPVLTCGFQVAEVLKVHLGLNSKIARQKVLELFEKTRLPDPVRIYESYPHQLSGGQKQRVMISMAVACKPKVLIADEPTTALDVTVQKDILLLLKSLCREENMGMIFISHDLGVISEVSDQILVLYKGQMVEKGPATEVLKNPIHPYTKGLISCRAKLDSEFYRLPVISDFMEIRDGAFLEKNDWVALERTPVKMAKEILLKVEGLEKTYSSGGGFFSQPNHFRALDNISLKVHKGETLGLVGESGCGKSTLGKCILKLIDVDRGSIIFDGHDVTKAEGRSLKSLRKRMQIIFQDPYSSLNPRMTIGDAIMEPMLVHNIGNNRKERRARMLNLLDRVGLLANQAELYPHEFSGGQRQRVCIARSLSVEPDFVVCDESVSALDVSVQAQVLNLLNELKEDMGLTYIFISHDLSVVKYMSDRLIVMNKGKIEEEGDPGQIYRSPASLYTKKLIDSLPIL